MYLEYRGTSSKFWVWFSPFLAVALSVLTGLILFYALGYAPLATIYTFFIAPVSSLYGVAELAVKATPLILIAIGLALGFRANVWNIGAEGQLIFGALLAGGYALWGPENILMLPIMLVLGGLGGALYAMIPAVLRVRFHANEILTSLMLTYVALLFLNYMVSGPFKDPEGYGFPQSQLFSESALLPLLIDGTRLHWGVLLAGGVILAAWVLLSRSFIGFQIKVVGLTPAAAGYAGFSQKRIIYFTLILSGVLAGIAGFCEIAGPIGQLSPTLSPGYGFTAIIVAFLGRLHPLGILCAGVLIALSYLGGENAQIVMGLPLAVTGIFQGMLLFTLLGCDVLVSYRIRHKRGGAWIQ